MFLTWHLPDRYPEGTEVGPVYRMVREYQPTAYWIYAKSAPISQDIIVDINKNGVSIFSLEINRPRLVRETSSYEQFVPFETFNEGDIITLDVDQRTDGAGPLTIQIDLEEA